MIGLLGSHYKLQSVAGSMGTNDSKADGRLYNRISDANCEVFMTLLYFSSDYLFLGVIVSLSSCFVCLFMFLSKQSLAWISNQN